MPLGFERLNERIQRPNKNINFIKPLEGPHKAIAQDILERVAAIVYPIMKKHYLYVMALEEFPPNREFWGRNFNGGEVIQLVLRNPHNGMWLPMPMIQSVMLHELAHNQEMNHSRRFHKHRLGYVAELSELKLKGYTGDGLWGRGRSLHPSADVTDDYQIPAELLPEELCGGVYRREKRKKKDQTKKVDYQEQKRRRIIKKFGSLEGNTVGGDEDIRQELEKGRKPKGKPRVAGSARGRDLRAEAALKRFETQKSNTPKKEDEETTESESEEEEGEMIKLEDEEVDEKAMMEEMSAFACGRSQSVEPSTDAFPEIEDQKDAPQEEEPPKTNTNVLKAMDTVKPKQGGGKESPIVLSDAEDVSSIPSISKEKSKKDNVAKVSKIEEGLGALASEWNAERICSACQVANEASAITCLVCSNVLKDDVGFWECTSTSCRNSSVPYRNSMDVSYCGICGGKR